MNTSKLFPFFKLFILVYILVFLVCIQCKGQSKRQVRIYRSQSVEFFCENYLRKDKNGKNNKIDIEKFLELNPQIKKNNILKPNTFVFIPTNVQGPDKPEPPTSTETISPNAKSSTTGINTHVSTEEAIPTTPVGKEIINTSTNKKAVFKATSLDKNNLLQQIAFQNKKYHLCQIDPRQYKIELFNKLENGQGVYNFSVLDDKKKDKLLFAMNGGMFEQSLYPVGLFISEGKTMKDINLTTGPDDNFHMVPNGVFGLDSEDKPFIIPSTEFKEFKNSKTIRLATQSGPMLVIRGKYHSKLTPGSTNVKIRNGVGINKQGQVLFIISDDPVNFYELAQLFKEQFQCENALYLDGVVSQYYIPLIDKKPRTGVSLGPILTVSKK